MDRDAATVSPGHLTAGQSGLYIVGGLLLAAAGAKPRPNLILNIAALAVGGYLAWRGAVGYCPAKAVLLPQLPHEPPQSQENETAVP